LKTWLVTGANRGLGFAIACAALASGDRVIAVARQPGQALVDLVPGHQGRIVFLPLDISDETATRRAVDQVKATWGAVDVLVNNAGYSQFGVFEQVTPSAVERQFRTNVFGTFAVARAILPLMRAQRSGHVLTVSSMAGPVGFKGASIYCASKFALEGWSEAMEQEVAPFGIRVTLVKPGFFRTD
jgi:NAD(P)-dependent dehydrogenase (short-subunit alcohol dehydrogenase family)